MEQLNIIEFLVTTCCYEKFYYVTLRFLLRHVRARFACARVITLNKIRSMSIFSLEASAERVFRLVEIILGVLSSLLAVLRKSFKEFNDDSDDAN